MGGLSSCSPAVSTIFFFGRFHIWGRHIEFSFAALSGLFFYFYSFHLYLFSCNITPPMFWSSYLSVSTHFHFPCLITTSSSVFLFTWPNHISLASLVFYIMFATPAIALISSVLNVSMLFIPIIHLNIIITVFSSKFCSALL